MSYSLKSVYCHGWEKIIVKETMISLSYKIGPGGEEAASFPPPLNYCPIWKFSLIGWQSLCGEACLPSRERQRGEPLQPGLPPREEGLQVAVSKCVCVQKGFWNDRRARLLPKQLWLWIAPTISASHSERRESLLPWEARSLGAFLPFFQFVVLFLKILSGGWWFLNKGETPSFKNILSQGLV